jgi:hypothetical protein
MNSKNRSLAAAEKLSARGVGLGESLDAALTQTQRNHGELGARANSGTQKGRPGNLSTSREQRQKETPWAVNWKQLNAWAVNQKQLNASAELLHETKSNEEVKKSAVSLIANHKRTKLGRMESTPKWKKVRRRNLRTKLCWEQRQTDVTHTENWTENFFGARKNKSLCGGNSSRRIKLIGPQI